MSRTIATAASGPSSLASPPSNIGKIIGDPPDDAILDRLVHNVHRLQLAEVETMIKQALMALVGPT